MSKKILIVGSQGYLGSRLTDYLQEYGYQCIGVDVGFFQYGVLYYPKAVPFLNKDARTITEEDLEGFDAVLFLAGISNDPFGNLSSEAIYDPTREYALRIAQMCKKLGIRYIFPSSCSVYGIGDGLLDEDSPVNPQTPYSLNKVQIEEDLNELADSSFSPIALRLATVFGASPRMRFDVVINMLCGMAVTQNKVVLNSDGQAWRPNLHIDDVCNSFRCCIEWDYNEGKLMVLNVGQNDNNWKILDIAKLIQSKVKGCEIKFLGQDEEDADNLVKDRKIQDGVDKRTYQVSFDRIHEILPEYQTRWDVKSGVEQLLDELERWKLNETKFKQREFYRLQQIEYLHEIKQIDDSLRFC
jgi:nucleoside-diphosphate-sugar epimerase